MRTNLPLFSGSHLFLMAMLLGCQIEWATPSAIWVLDIEERILIVLPDCPQFVWTWFGAARIGSVITMVNPLLPAADYSYYLEYACWCRRHPSLAFADLPRKPRVKPRTTLGRCS